MPGAAAGTCGLTTTMPCLLHRGPTRPCASPSNMRSGSFQIQAVPFIKRVSPVLKILCAHAIDTIFESAHTHDLIPRNWFHQASNVFSPGAGSPPCASKPPCSTNRTAPSASGKPNWRSRGLARHGDLLELARELGATHTIDATNSVAAVHGICGGPPTTHWNTRATSPSCACPPDRLNPKPPPTLHRTQKASSCLSPANC